MQVFSTITEDDVISLYAGRHDEVTRNIAELINAVPSNAAPWVKETMQECAKLYRKKHGIKKSAVEAAVKDHAISEVAFAALTVEQHRIDG